ncbi:hypothetical protein F4776DRAFT_675639 [Hypoxylon sp. NC0597]|nr:hypothetical protein F4776DRAFT_675639 [Hypoxylon sp. NC0597]
MSSRRPSIKKSIEGDESPPRNTRKRPLEVDEDEDEDVPPRSKRRSESIEEVRRVLDRLRLRRGSAHLSQEEEHISPEPPLKEEELEPVPEEQPLPSPPSPPASLATMPAEVLLLILGYSGRDEHLNLGVALPEIFVTARLNVFAMDARNQWFNRRRERPSLEGVVLGVFNYYEDPIHTPLLLVAIRQEHSIDTINQIIDAYNSVSPDAVNDIFLYRQYLTPLETAVNISRPDLLRVLLDRGLDPNLRGHLNSRLLRLYRPQMCLLQAVTHRTCGMPTPGHDHWADCDGLLGCAITLYSNFRRRTASISSRELLSRLEECIIILHERDPIAVTDGNRLGNLFNRLLEAGVDGLIRHIIEETVSGGGQQRDRLMERMPSIIERLLETYEDGDMESPLSEVGTQRQTARMLRAARRDDLIHYVITDLSATFRPGPLAAEMLRNRVSRGPLTALQAILAAGNNDEATFDLLMNLTNGSLVNVSNTTFEINRLWVERLLSLLISRDTALAGRFLFSAVRDLNNPILLLHPRADSRQMYRWMLREYVPLNLQTIFLAINRRDNTLLSELIRSRLGDVGDVFNSDILPSAALPAQFRPSRDVLPRAPDGSYLEESNDLYDSLAFWGRTPFEVAILTLNSYAANRLLILGANPERLRQDARDWLFEQFEANALSLDVWAEVGRAVLGDRFTQFDPQNQGE